MPGFVSSGHFRVFSGLTTCLAGALTVLSLNTVYSHEFVRKSARFVAAKFVAHRMADLLIWRTYEVIIRLTNIYDITTIFKSDTY